MPRLMNNRYRNTHMLTVDEVVDLDSLIDFLNSRVGAPRPTQKEKAGAAKQAKDFFESYPDADWRALTDLATWAKVRQKHLSMAQLVGSWRYAYEDGFMQILERGGSTNDEETLHEMLKTVDDPAVRTRMMNASTSDARDKIWHSYHDTNDDTTKGDVTPTDNDPLGDYGLAQGQAVKVRLSAADSPTTGTVVGLSDDQRLLVYLKGETLPVDWDLVYVRNDGAWEALL